MKLHVGCGKKKINGYKHQDIVAYKHIDYCSPSWIVNEKDKTFEEIYSRHFFEHLYPWEAENTLKEWKRILKDDGKIIMSLPNLEFHAKQLLMEGKSKYIKSDISNFEHAIHSIYGWVNKGNKYMEHKWGYTKKSLTQLLSKYFTKIKFNDNNIRDLEVEIWK